MQQQCAEGRWSESHQQHHWRAERAGAVFEMNCLSTGRDQAGAELCSCSGVVSSWGSRLGVAGTEVWIGVCWGSGAAGILPLAFLQTMKGLPPARLLSFCCCTALLLGWEEETWL